jgi:hypothetical protein
MSDVKRYDLELCDGESGRCGARLAKSSDGDYVLHPDHLAALTAAQARCERLEKAVEEVRAVVAKLKAGNGDEYDIGCIVDGALAPLLTTPERTAPPQGEERES